LSLELRDVFLDACLRTQFFYGMFIVEVDFSFCESYFYLAALFFSAD